MHTFAGLIAALSLLPPFAVLAQDVRPALGTPRDAAAVADSTATFPMVDGRNLEGRRFTLPADFEGRLNVVLVAFRREQQADVDTWMPFLKAVAAARSDVRAYELPTLARSYRVMRSFIDGGMARGIPARATREATITLYINKGPFRAALGIGSEDQIVTFLVSDDGRVLWRADGAFTPDLGAALDAALSSASGTGN